jgi:hypothetical protein
VRPFDPKSYLGDVLAPSVDSAELPSLFDRYLIEVDDDDEGAIESRLDEVKRYWDKKSEHPRYGATIRNLIDKHPEAKLTLGDARERECLADEVRERERERAEALARAVKEWDELLAQVVHQGSGLDPTQRARLEKMAAGAGLAGPEVQRKLDAAPVAAEPEVLDGSQRAVISGALTNLARELGEPRVSLSLYHAFGLEIGEEREAVEARHREQAQENRRRSHGNTKASWDSVLSLVKIHLLENDPRGYINGVMLDVREALELRAMRAAADDGEIDEVEAEQLLREALELGLTAGLAQRVVAELAREHGAGLRTGATVDFVACPSCNHPHRRDAGHEHCERCGAALYIDCPGGCGRRNDATAARCIDCGADLHRYAVAIRAVARLPELVDEGRLGHARAELEEATRVLGNSNAELAASRRTVMSAVESANRGWAEVEQARRERRHFAATGRLEELEKSARDLPGPTGDLPGEALESSRRRVGEARKALAGAQRLEGAPREAALIEALQLASDCVEAERELDKLPIEPPSEVEATVRDTTTTVSWGASSTRGAEYLISRESGGRRTVVGETGELQIDDAGVPPGAHVRYAVAAVRGRARSTAAISAPIVAAHEVSDLSTIAGDGEVRLTWKLGGESGRPVVMRRDERDSADVPIGADAGGATDRGVVNGLRYTYLVRVEYPGPGGEIVSTPGRTVFAQPVERPEPLAELSVRAGPSGVVLGFEPPENGAVSVFRCDEDPELKPGTTLDQSSLVELGQALEVRGASAVDPSPPTGSCFYQAVTVAGMVAVAGVAVRNVALPEIANVRAVANGRRAQVTWTWPDGITLAHVVWRHDRQPDGPEDANAEAIDYRRGEYRDRGGFPIELGEHRSLFVAVFPATRAGGEIAYGSGGGKRVRANLRMEDKTELRYSVRRAGMLQKRLEIEVSQPADGALPQLVLVGREGEILPRGAGDGKVLARLGGDGPRRSTVGLRDLPRPLAVRLFLDSASASGSFVLFDPAPEQLLVE